MFPWELAHGSIKQSGQYCLRRINQCKWEESFGVQLVASAKCSPCFLHVDLATWEWQTGRRVNLVALQGRFRPRTAFLVRIWVWSMQSTGQLGWAQCHDFYILHNLKLCKKRITKTTSTLSEKCLNRLLPGCEWKGLLFLWRRGEETGKRSGTPRIITTRLGQRNTQKAPDYW